MALTNVQKADLAHALLIQAGNLVEYRDHYVDQLHSSLQNATTEDIATQLTIWLQRLPGEWWDSRLPKPDAIRDGRKGYGS
ncbi:hypothetical protein SEA_RIPARIAN_45 [Mycobacterium phage Riparian]|uniref:Uncharacterized protein n=1 Tax=Mycobacterium phage Riparian TaxID=2341079 RepID=A0A3G3LWM8_9CAUD|nr:hypothetical protein SEA_RIPARIAN_45 [Mycobacterium phage Riparian]